MNIVPLESIKNDSENLTLQKQSESLLKKAQMHQINTEVDQSAATELIGQVKSILKALEGRRKAFTTGANDYIKTVNILYRGLKEPLERAEKVLKQKMGAFFRKQEELRQKEEIKLKKKMDRAAEKGKEIPIEQPKIESQKSVKTENSGASFIKVWKHEIIDAEKVPREFCKPDEVKLNAAVKAGLRSIPGVKIYEDVQTRIKTYWQD